MNACYWITFLFFKQASFYEPQVQKTVDTKCGDLKLPYNCHVLLPDKYKKNLLRTLTIDFNKAHEIQEGTQEQSNSPRWHEERTSRARLTASKFYEILYKKSISLKYVRTILDPKPFKITLISYRIASEKKAREMYLKRQELHVHACGLCINPEFSFLVARWNCLWQRYKCDYWNQVPLHRQRYDHWTITLSSKFLFAWNWW